MSNLPFWAWDFVVEKGLKVNSILTVKVISVEKIFLEKRLRHFGLDPLGNTFFDKENNFYITSDNDGLYKVNFNKFR